MDAWMTMINVCGRMGRVDMAMKLFHIMQKFEVRPNLVTCGCLLDYFLKMNVVRIIEMLEVL